MTTSNASPNMTSPRGMINKAGMETYGDIREVWPGGAVVPDICVINDVVLRISPNQISIDKRSNNHEWQTLRTRSSQKMKSGHAAADVSLQLTFESKDFYTSLAPLVAGLRASPWVAISNAYLEQQLKTMGLKYEDSDAQQAEKRVGSSFRPVVLALREATFTTGGHEGMPSVITARLEFSWFNYLPYTPFWAYATGSSNSMPGYAWDSALWKAFYKPYLKVAPFFPHGGVTGTWPATTFSWREYALISKGAPFSYELAEAVIKSIKDNPELYVKTGKEALAAGEDADLPLSAVNIPDLLLRTAALDQRITGHYGLAKAKEISRDGDTQAAAAIDNLMSGPLSKSFQIAAKQGVAAGARYLDTIGSRQLKNSISILKKQAARLTKATLAGINSEAAGADYQPVLTSEAKYERGGNSFSVGESVLMGRKAKLRIAPQEDVAQFGPGSSTLIESISFSFSNNLAVIPMAGYRYPTMQHIGSQDMRVTMALNATHRGASKLQRMYDTVEDMALSFRQVPQPFLNLRIENDFLDLFGVKEFITEGMTSVTVPGQPGRSQVVLQLSDAGVTSQDKLRDDETISQEKIQSHDSVNQAIWKVIRKNYKWYKKDKYSPRLAGPDITSPPKGKKAYYWFVSRMAQTYSHFMKTATAGKSRSEIHGVLSALRSIPYSTGYGYIPGYDDIIKDITAAASRPDSAGGENNVHTNWQAKDAAIADKQKQRLSIDSKYFGTQRALKRANFKAGAAGRVSVTLSEAGLNKYLQWMSWYFNKLVDGGYLTLSEFKHIAERRDKLGLGRGIPAYPDFEPSLSSCLEVLNGKGVLFAPKQSVAGKDSSVNSIHDVDPDVYMWYPLFSKGSSSSPLVDERFRTHAVKLGLDMHNQAATSVSEFYTSKYADAMKSSLLPHLVPGAKASKKGVVVPANLRTPFSASLSGGYPSALSQEQIKKSLLIDPASKAHTNIPIKGSLMSPAVGCTHDAHDPSKWAGGISHGGAAATPPPPVGASNKKEAKKAAGEGALMSRSQKSEAKLLADTKEPFTSRLKFVLAALRARGHDVKISNTYRSPAGQYSKWQKGYSGSKEKGWRPGAHTWGVAADIIQRQDAWKVTARTVALYTDLKVIAKTYGLHWGGNYTRSNPAWAKHGIGWDPAHLQLEWKDIPTKARTDLRTGKPTSREWSKLPPGQASTETGVGTSGTGVGNNQSPYFKALSAFEEEILRGQGQSMMRAYPTFKLYFIEDDSGQEQKRLAYDDFFSYNSVQSIRIIRSRKIAADLCEIYVTNVSGVLTNRKFKNQRSADGKKDISGAARDSKGGVVKENPNKAGTAGENPIASMLLQEGQNISLRLGYSNDPDKLTTVFNGAITGVEMTDSEDIIRIVAQSYATELIRDIKGIEEPSLYNSSTLFGWDFWGLTDESSTARILEEMLSEPEVVHFGRWKAGSPGTANRTLLTEKYQFVARPQDDNLFPPPAAKEITDLGDKWWHTLSYVIFQTTIWDVINEMCMRHPNYIASPVPYRDMTGERMTLFFGLPEQLYFARHPSSKEQQTQSKLQRVEEEIKKKQAAAKLEYNASMALTAEGRKLYDKSKTPASAKRALSSLHALSVAGGVQRRVRELRLAQALQDGYIKPFRDYHLLTSDNHIISNNIRANSRDVANTVVIQYRDDLDDADSSSELKLVMAKGPEEAVTVKLDSALPTEEIRTQIGSFLNVHTEALAQRYGLSLLLQNCKDIYKGSITIIGNPNIKPYDVCYVYDDYSDMVGPIEVEQVVHVFDQRQGFRTEIVPDMLCWANHWATMSTVSIMGHVMEAALKDVFNVESSRYAPFANMVGQGVTAWGGFLTNMLVSYTPSGHPISMLPLTHHGRPMSGGVPIRKIPTMLWENVLGKWDSRYDAGKEAWWEDTYEDITDWAKKWTGQRSAGTFLSD